MYVCVAVPPRAAPPLPRPVLPRERGLMDRMLDYLVGDGPANRYALICCQCQSHNGMALKEEFEYLGERRAATHATHAHAAVRGTLAVLPTAICETPSSRVICQSSLRQSPSSQSSRSHPSSHRQCSFRVIQSSVVPAADSVSFPQFPSFHSMIS